MAKELSERTEQRRGETSRRGEQSPVREMIGLRDTINGLFEDFFSGRPILAGRLMSGEPETGWLPPVDIWDAGNEIVVCAGLIGIKKEDCKIEVQDSTLVLSGECRQPADEKGELLRHEIPCGQFYRAFSLPADVKSEQVKATFRDGLLEVHLPKAENAKARRVEIQ